MSFLKILSSSQIKSWDEYTIQNEPVSSIDLMERAAIKCAEWLIKNTDISIKASDTIKIMCGTGNNGGDGLAIARLLHESGYQPEVYIVSESLKSSHDFNRNLERLKKQGTLNITEANNADEIELADSDIVIDAMLGSGLNKPLEGLLAETVEKVNASGATVIAIDVPTGFPATIIDTSIETAIKAHFTLTFQLPKLRMLFPESYSYTGEIRVLDIGLMEQFNISAESNYYFLTQKYVQKLLKIRKKFDHKGTFGHALIIAGSYGKMGAAVLSAKACLRSGVGLLTVAIPKTGNDIIQTSVPEAMAYSIEEHERYVTSFPKINVFKSIGIGPGIEKKPVTKLMLKNLLNQPELPSLVIDADGLNLLAENLQEKPDFKIPENAILTPHVKEFDRLAGKSENSIERHYKQLEFSQKHKVYVLLKGAYTAIATPDGKCYFNSTGNPGMGTGGSGDVLTGILTGLKAQGYTELETCILGVYLHGLAGDLAARENGKESLIATDIIENIGKAFAALKHPTT